MAGPSGTPVESDQRSDLTALVFGVITSAVLSGTLVIAGLKAGITPGVSPLVVLIAWGLFRAWRNATGGTRAFNIAQVAGSSGMAVTAGVIFTAPMFPIVMESLGYEPTLPPLPILILMSVAGALIGFGFVGSAAQRFLADPTYPAPEARAAATLVETATEDSSNTPELKTSLVPALFLGFVAPLLIRLELAREHLVLFARDVQERSFQLDVPFTPIYIGIGALLTAGTAFLLFCGSGLRLVGDFVLTTMPFGMSSETWPAQSMRWVGGAAMSVAVAWSLGRYFLTTGNEHQKVDNEEFPELDEVSITTFDGRLLITSLFTGFGLVVGFLVAEAGITPFSMTMMVVVLVTASLMTLLGAILSLQIGSSASPVSGTVFVTVLVLCLVVLAFGLPGTPETAYLLTCVIVAACVAVCSANDASQDYRTLQFCGVPVRAGFVGQLIGLIVGAFVVPVVLTVSHEAYGLGTEALPAPQGQMFATLVEGLLFTQQVPWAPIAVGTLVGLGAVGLERLGRKQGVSLPSMALAVGIYLPAYLGIGVLLGAVVRLVAERGAMQTHRSILVAAGLITGAAGFDLLYGIGILSGWGVTSFAFENVGGATTTSVAVAGLIVIMTLIYRTSRPSS
jgi:putative OPT family oligopeptide transporter